MRIFWDPNLWGRAVKHPGNFLSYLTWKMGMRILLRCAIRLDEWETGSARTIDRAYGKEARAPESTVEAGQELGRSQAPSCLLLASSLAGRGSQDVLGSYAHCARCIQVMFTQALQGNK